MKDWILQKYWMFRWYWALFKFYYKMFRASNFTFKKRCQFIRLLNKEMNLNNLLNIAINDSKCSHAVTKAIVTAREFTKGNGYPYWLDDDPEYQKALSYALGIVLKRHGPELGIKEK